MFDTGSMNETLFLSLYFKNTVDVLFWSIVLDIVVAIKITSYKGCLLTFRDYRGKNFLIALVPFEVMR